MKGEDVSSLYIAQARQLEEQGKFKDAERSAQNLVHTQYFLAKVELFKCGHSY